MRQSASKLFVFCSACPIILWGVSGIVFANRNNDRWAENQTRGFWRIALRPRCVILLLHLCSQLATVCARVFLLSPSEKNKRFGTDGISLCLDSFQNAISSVMAVVHVIRNKEEPPLLRFRGINGNLQSACSNVLLA